MKRITIQLEDDLHQLVSDASKKAFRSISSQINWLIQKGHKEDSNIDVLWSKKFDKNVESGCPGGLSFIAIIKIGPVEFTVIRDANKERKGTSEGFYNWPDDVFTVMNGSLSSEELSDMINKLCK